MRDVNSNVLQLQRGDRTITIHMYQSVHATIDNRMIVAMLIGWSSQGGEVRRCTISLPSGRTRFVTPEQIEPYYLSGKPVTVQWCDESRVRAINMMVDGQLMLVDTDTDEDPEVGQITRIRLSSNEPWELFWVEADHVEEGCPCFKVSDAR